MRAFPLLPLLVCFGLALCLQPQVQAAPKASDTTPKAPDTTEPLLEKDGLKISISAVETLDTTVALPSTLEDLGRRDQARYPDRSGPRSYLRG